MKRKRIAVLRGGPSFEYDISMKTGAAVLQALSELGYEVLDIPVTKDGQWLREGRVKSPEQALLAVDVAFIAMHGAYGEDGTIQRIFERLHIPFTGSNSFPSNVAFNKDLTKRTLRDTGIKMPKHIKVQRQYANQISEIVSAITTSFGPEYVIKPALGGSSHGVIMVSGSNELADGIKISLQAYEECLVEERIRGTEATCAVLGDFRGYTLYALPPVEIIPASGHNYFDNVAKYDGSTTEICPGRFAYNEKQKMLDLATLVHQTLGLSQYSRTDCIVRDGEIYFLEVNTLPGLTSESLYPKAATAVGLSFRQLISHLVTTAAVRI